MGKQLDTSGWVAIQISNFMDRFKRSDGIQLGYYLAQLNSIPVCVGIIRQLLVENRELKQRLGENGRKWHDRQDGC